MHKEIIRTNYRCSFWDNTTTKLQTLLEDLASVDTRHWATDCDNSNARSALLLLREAYISALDAFQDSINDKINVLQILGHDEQEKPHEQADSF